MLTYKKLSKKPNSFRSFTGLAVEEFNKLYNIIEKKYNDSERKRLNRKDRIHAIGQGRGFKLKLKERLIMILVYYRLYISYELEGFLFDLDQSNVWRNIKYLEPLVKRCIPLPEKLHKRTKKIGTIEELLKYYPEMKAFVDATEHEIQRPKNKRKRKSHYSGKKKKHTVKTQILVNKKGIIIHKTKRRKGREHDYNIWKRTNPSVPPDVEVGMDLGYQGMQKDFPDVKSRLPVKKPRGKSLTKKQRRYNKKQRKERVIVEHTIAKIKKFNIIGTKFRNRLNTYDTKMSVVTGLVNFRTILREGMDIVEFVG